MNAPARLGVFALILAVAFGAAFVIAGAIAPDDAADQWVPTDHDRHASAEHRTTDHGTGDAPGAVPQPETYGLTLEAGGVRMADLSASTTTQDAGLLTLELVQGSAADPVPLRTQHGVDLHVIAVRSDGTHLQRRPAQAAGPGQWSAESNWTAPGTYRIFAEAVHEGTGEPILVSRTLEVRDSSGPGSSEPEASETELLESSVSSDGGELTVQLEGELHPGRESTLSATVTRDGAPVTTLEQYTGAYGHLSVLREGDLAYLPSHAHGGTAGPELRFTVTPPTAGRYLVYLDIRLDGHTHTLPFVVTAHPGGAG